MRPRRGPRGVAAVAAAVNPLPPHMMQCIWHTDSLHARIARQRAEPVPRLQGTTRAGIAIGAGNGGRAVRSIRVGSWPGLRDADAVFY